MRALKIRKSSVFSNLMSPSSPVPRLSVVKGETSKELDDQLITVYEQLRSRPPSIASPSRNAKSSAVPKPSFSHYAARIVHQQQDLHDKAVKQITDNFQEAKPINKTRRPRSSTPQKAPSKRSIASKNDRKNPNVAKPTCKGWNSSSKPYGTPHYANHHPKKTSGLPENKPELSQSKKRTNTPYMYKNPYEITPKSKLNAKTKNSSNSQERRSATPQMIISEKSSELVASIFEQKTANLPARDAMLYDKLNKFYENKVWVCQGSCASCDKCAGKQLKEQLVREVSSFMQRRRANEKGS